MRDARPIIRYDRLWRVLTHFKSLGYDVCELEWTASAEAIKLTYPEYTGTGSCTIGSAEQSFLDLALNGELDEGKNYVSLTPCSRNEEHLSDITYTSFMKVELFSLGVSKWEIFLEDARNAMNQMTGDPLIKLSTGVNSADLILNDIEVGSYGYRESGVLNWSYGTGMAEPRFSVAAMNQKLDGKEL